MWQWDAVKRPIVFFIKRYGLNKKLLLYLHFIAHSQVKPDMIHRLLIS